MGKIITKILVTLIFIVAIGLIVGSVIFAVNNENNRINEGIIVAKNYTAAHTTYTTVNKIVIPTFHSESYTFCIEGEKDGRTVEYWFDCTAEEYAAYNVGDYFKR